VTEIALLLGGAALAHAVCRITGLPAIPVMVVAGSLLALGGWISADEIQEILVLSAAVLVFSAGTELAPEKAGQQWGAALRVGAIQFVALGLAGLGVSYALGFRGFSLAYLAVATAASSTLVGIRILQRRRELFEPSGRLVAGVLLLQDLIVILTAPFLQGLGAELQAALLPLGGTALLLAGAWGVKRRVTPFAARRIDEDREVWLLSFLALLFVFAGVGGAMDVPVVTSAFLAGFALSGYPVSTVARAQLDSLTTFFGALFFTALGTFLAAPAPDDLLAGVALALTVIVVTPAVVGIVAEREGFSARSALTGGFLLAQTSEFSLVIGLQGFVAGVLAPQAFTAIAVSTVITMALTPLLVQDRFVWHLVHLHPFRRRTEPPSHLRDHVLLLGCGSNGSAVLDLLLTYSVPAAVVEEDPAVVRSLQEAEIPAFRGDASDRSVLTAAGLPRTRLVICTLPRARDAGVALEAAPAIPVLVRVFEAEEEAWVRDRGGTPVSYAEAAADDFFHWFDEASGSEPRGRPSAPSL